MTDKTAQFYVAPFAFDGALVGVEPYDLSRLSPRWIGVCQNMLARHGGASFRTALDQNLSHLEIALTSFGGVGVATFYAHGNIAASHAFCTGGNRTAEDEVLRMFVDSLRRVDVVRKAQVTERPFEAALTIEERPLWVVVAWGNPAVSAQDEQLIRELGVHFAAAFLTDAEKGANKQIHHIPKR